MKLLTCAFETCRNPEARLVCFQFVSEQRHEDSVQEAQREDEQGAGRGAEGQQGAQQVAEQQQQQRPVAGQQPQAQPRLTLPLQRPPGHRAALRSAGGVGIRQVVTAEATQEVRTGAESVHVPSELWER